MKALICSILIMGVLYMFAPPRDFPAGRKIEINPNQDAGGIARILSRESVIVSETVFKILARVTGAAHELRAGRYVFDRPLPVWTVLSRVQSGEYGTKVRKVVIPEGSNNKQINEILGFDIGEGDQGYLFPDTYYFDEFATSEEARYVMKETFRQKAGDISYDDLILASIIEKEASSTEDRRLIAGVLERRLELGMPLQVDVALETYERIGLPTRPIVNPGLDAINAVRNPAPSKYLYYLSDKNGATHYALTFEEHNRNRAKYGI